MPDNFAAAMEAMQLTPQEQFLYQYHLNNLAGPEQAIANAQAMGLANFPAYKDEKEAQARYDQMHDFMERDIKSFREPPPNVSDALNGSPVDNALAAPAKGPR